MILVRILTLILLLTVLSGSRIAAAERPNILVISIDDLNDWVGCLGGHPQAKTPNIDRLAKRGTLFANAHCQAPICTPSRASLVSGLYPHTTGLYFLNPGLEASEVTKNRKTLVEHFADEGYATFGAGKFYHKNEAKYFQEYGGGMGGFGPLPKKKLSHPDGLKLWDWGPFPEDESQMPDTKVADWIIRKLKEDHSKPFFLVAGFWRPHVPMYAPPRWFKSFPLKTIKLPQVIRGDRDDLPPYALDLTAGFPAPRHSWFVENDAWHGAVQSYLASVAFADHCAGRVLDALESSSHRSNTIVVLLSDHGWHLGEKERWAKRSLWHDSTHVPLIIAGPGLPSGQVREQPVGLIDIFPTLVELAGVHSVNDLDGRSLKPLLDDATREWPTPALTTLAPGNHSLRFTNWHYIRYADGSEELYDHKTDPHEWANLAAHPESASRLANFREHLPQKNRPPIVGEWKNWEIEAWQAAEKNAAQRRSN
jgi:arylsulfatase A-like enzyme